MANTGARRPLEKDIQNSISAWLRINDVLFWRSNNVPVFSMNNAGKMTFRSLPKDTPRGLPDLMIIKDGRFIGVEVKRPGAKLRPEQGNFGMRLVQAGALYWTVHSLDEFVDYYKGI